MVLWVECRGSSWPDDEPPSRKAATPARSEMGDTTGHARDYALTLLPHEDHLFCLTDMTISLPLPPVLTSPQSRRCPRHAHAARRHPGTVEGPQLSQAPCVNYSLSVAGAGGTSRFSPLAFTWLSYRWKGGRGHQSVSAEPGRTWSPDTTASLPILPGRIPTGLPNPPQSPGSERARTPPRERGYPPQQMGLCRCTSGQASAEPERVRADTGQGGPSPVYL